MKIMVQTIRCFSIHTFWISLWVTWFSRNQFLFYNSGIPSCQNRNITRISPFCSAEWQPAFIIFNENPWMIPLTGTNVSTIHWSCFMLCKECFKSDITITDRYTGIHSGLVLSSLLASNKLVQTSKQHILEWTITYVTIKTIVLCRHWFYYIHVL